MERKRPWSRFRSQISLIPKRVTQFTRFGSAERLLAAGHSVA